jgi:hypothetical protein
MKKQEEPYERDRSCREHHRSGDAEYEHRQDTHQYQWKPHPIRRASCPRRAPFRKEVAALPAPSRAFAHAFLAAGAGLPLHGTAGLRTKADCSTAGLTEEGLVARLGACRGATPKRAISGTGERLPLAFSTGYEGQP